MEPALEWLAPLSSREHPIAYVQPTIHGKDSEMDDGESSGLDQGRHDEGKDEGRGVELSEMARYWSARIHQGLSQRHRAQQLYRSVAEDHPFSYYSTMAWARLAQMGCAPALDVEPRDDPVPDSVRPEVGAALAYYKMGLMAEARLTLNNLTRQDLSSLQDRRWAATGWAIMSVRTEWPQAPGDPD